MSSGPIYYMPEDAANWEPIGKRKITDGFLPDVYHHEPISYEVEVEKSLVTEGLFRVVDMYGDTHPYASRSTHISTVKTPRHAISPRVQPE